MTWRTVLALAIFVGVCGFIAYVGDILGRRMGKRRLSLFGLRPRYTAIVSTTITGMLIAVFTIAVMTSVSDDVKQLVLRGEQVLAKYKSAVNELRQQERITTKARREAAEAVQTRDLLAAERELLTSKVEKTERQVAEGKKEIEKQQAEIADLEAERADLIHDLRVLSEDMGQAITKWQGYIALRQGLVIFRSNEELARRVIQCARPKLDIRADVLGLLNDADERARQAGAEVGRNGRAVKILPKKAETGEPGGGQFLKESQSIDAIVDLIFSSSGSVVARIISVGNSVEGEQALVEFALNYNRPVYSAGEEVARTVMDGSASQGQVLGQVIGFLRTEVRPAAMKKGVIPRYDEEQGQPSVGQLSPDQLFDIVDRVKAAGRRVTLTAVAKAETWSADALELDFRIEATE